MKMKEGKIILCKSDTINIVLSMLMVQIGKLFVGQLLILKVLVLGDKVQKIYPCGNAKDHLFLGDKIIPFIYNQKKIFNIMELDYQID